MSECRRAFEANLLGYCLMNSLRIAIFTPTFLPKCSGAEIFHHNLAKEFSAMGHHPVVILPRALHRRLDAFLPYETTGFPANLWSYFKYSTALAFLLNRIALNQLQRRYRFDVWHAVVLSPSGVCFANWQSRCRIPGLIRAVGDDVKPVTPDDPKSSMQELIQKWIPRAQKIVSLSRDMSFQLENLGVDREKIEIIPNAVDMDRFSEPADKMLLRKEYGIPTDAFVFLCVARNHPQKDFPTLLVAFQKLLKSRSDRKIHLVIVGRGVPLLKEPLASLDIQHAVTLMELSAIPEKPLEFPPQSLVDIYRASDAFVLSSLLEGFSSALLEAMAAGLPIVATNVPGIVDQVQDYKEALLVQCGNTEVFAEKMLELLNGSNLINTMRKNALARAKGFNWPKVASLYLRTYENLIA